MNEQKLIKRRNKALRDNNENLLVSVCTDLASLYIEEGRYNDAIDEYKSIAEIYKKQNKLLDYATAHRGIGEAYLGLQQFDKAVEHQKIHLGIARELKSKIEEQRALATIGHTYLTCYLGAPDDESDKNSLNLANKYFVKSSMICELLNGEITKLEWADMSARLYANLGLVQECLGNTDKALELINKSINLCKIHDIYEQLLRGYLSLASLFEKRGERKSALQQYNFAVETAKKLKDKPSLLSGALSSKAEILIKLGDFRGAKHALLKAYKLKIHNEAEHKTIEKSLKTVAAMNCNEDKILTTKETDYKQLKQLYEKMGDACCEFKCYEKAIDYYKKMLDAATNNNCTPSELATCYYSLGETFKDNCEYNEAIKYYQMELDLVQNQLKESLNTLFRIADTKELSKKSVGEVLEVYKKALEKCRKESNKHEEGRVLKFCIEYLRRQNQHSEAFQYEQMLKTLNYISSESGSENSEAETTIGDEINIEDITDISSNSDSEQIPRPKRRSKTFVIKRNIKGETQLHTACINGKLNVVHHLLEQGHPVNVRDHCGWLPLHEACIWGHLDIVKLLIEKGAAINDRGGIHCGGITPLHDAASNGHLHIVQYLLDKGANAVVKSDDNETILDFLKIWRDGNPTIDNDDDEKLYNELYGRISVALNKIGHSSPNKSISPKNLQQNKWNSKRSPLKIVDNIKRTTKKDLRRSNSNNYEGDLYSPSKQIEEEPSKNLRRSSSIGLDEPSTSKNIASDYRNVMDSLRHKNRNLSVNNTQNTVKRSALISIDDGDDDWLEDDIGKSVKKRKTNSSSPFSEKTRRFSKQSDSSESHIILSDDEMISLNSDPPVIDDDDSMPSNNSPLKNKDTNTIFDTLSSRSPIKNKWKPLSLNKRNTIQPKLQTFCHNRNLVEADSTSSPSHRSPLKKTFSRNQSLENIMPSIEPTVHVDVKINGKFYRVPVLLSQVNTKSIKWLAEEAALRYAKKEYIKPILELETSNGAILADDDVVSTLFSVGTMEAEPVEGRVKKWSIPPLVNRFKEACNDMNTKPEETICKQLQEVSISLNLSNKGLQEHTLAPLCKALNRESTLIELDLSKNFLTTECFQLLANSLPSLDNLDKLDLNCTALSSEHLQLLSNAFTTDFKLRYLDLSDNYLEDDSFSPLANITKYCKLKVLNLSSNNLSKDILNRSYNINVKLTLNFLEEFNVSDNQLNNEAVIKFVSWLDPNLLKNLDLSRNGIQHGLLGGLLVVFMENANRNLTLKSFKMSRCEVQDSELINLLTMIDGIDYLDLSYTPALTAISLRSLLESDLVGNINLIGCTNILNYFDFNFTKGPNCKTIKLSVDSQHNVLECQHLNDLWIETYGSSDVIVEKMPQFFSLSVV